MPPSKMLAWALLLAVQHGVVMPSPVHNSDPQLKAWYQESNAAYFDNKLPDIPIYWEKLPSGVYAETACPLSWPTDGNADLCVIRVSEVFRQRALLPIAVHAVLHESCHVEDHRHARPLDSHGDQWQACMLRLATAGAFKDLW